jgi:hypothetical protein
VGERQRDAALDQQQAGADEHAPGETRERNPGRSSVFSRRTVAPELAKTLRERRAGERNG